MSKILLLLICVVRIYLGLSASTSIECLYNSFDWFILKNTYYCHVQNNPSIITEELATITSVTGNHKNGKTNSDVDGLNYFSKTAHYFPRGLETFYKNLKFICIGSSELKVVRQKDLKPFSELIVLVLYRNSLEVLEEGLFDFNPHLECIKFENNKIVHIEPNIFDHLSKLSILRLDSNTCITKGAQNSISEVKNVIQAAKSQCINSDFSSLKAQLENLEKESKTLNSEDFLVKMAPLKSSLKSSKFINFRPLNYKFEALLNTKFENIMLEKTSKIEDKLSKMTELVAKVNTDVIEGFGSTNSVLKADQSTILGSINNVCTKESLTQVLTNQQEILNVQNKIRSSFDTLNSTLNLVKVDVSSVVNSKALKLESSINQHSQDMQNTLRTSKNEILGKVCTKESLIEVRDIQRKNEDEFGNYQSHFNTSIDDLQKSMIKGLTDVTANVNALKIATDQGLTSFNMSINALDSKVNILTSVQDQVKSSQDDIKSSIDDLEASLNSLKSSQNDVKLSVNKIKSSQYEMKASIDNLKVHQDDNADDKFKSFGDEVKGQLKDVEEQLADFKAEMVEKLAQNEKELAKTRHKITLAMDEKIKGIENRLMKKFEDVLEDKIGKILEEKFLKFMGN